MKSMLHSSLPLLLAGCVTASVEPSSVHQSAKSRQAVVDCILNRFDGRRPIINAGPASTTVRFVGPLGNAGLITTTSDLEKGSVTEIRGGGQIVLSGLTSLKTCF
jgi:hypothetical protein